MRWKGKILSKSNERDLRHIKKFIWFPKCLWDLQTHRREWRWLEYSLVVQRVFDVDIDNEEWVKHTLFWCDIAWFPDRRM